MSLMDHTKHELQSLEIAARVSTYECSARPSKLANRYPLLHRTFLMIKGNLLPISIVAIISLLLSLIFLALFSHSENKSLLAIVEKSSPHLRALVAELISDDIPLERKREVIKEIAEDQGSEADQLIKIILTNSLFGMDLQQEAKSALLKRIEKIGYPHVSKLFSEWLNETTIRTDSNKKLKEWDLMIATINLQSSLHQKQDYVSTLYQISPELAVQLIAAMELDEQKERFVTMLKTLLSVDHPGEDFTPHPFNALMLTEDNLLELLGSSISVIVQKLPPEELIWSLTILAKSGSNKVLDFLHVIYEQKAHFQLRQRELLTTLRQLQETFTPIQIQSSILRIIFSAERREDILVVSRWESKEVEKILSIITIISKVEEHRLLALENLAGRTLTNRIAEKLMRWLKNNHWSHRRKLAQSFGIMSLIESSSPEETKIAFDQLVHILDGQNLLDITLEINNPKLIKETVERYGAILPTETLFPLLALEDKTVKIAVLNILSHKDENDLQKLQKLVSAFDQEKDPEVKHIYRQLYWVIRDR